MEDLEIRQLLSGALYRVTLVTNSQRPNATTMLTLDHGVTDPNDPTLQVASIYEEKPDGMSGTDFLESLVHGTITGTIWVGDPAVETPVSFQFPQAASDVQGDAPIYIQISGDDETGFGGNLFVDDDYAYEDPSGHSYNNGEWSFQMTPAPRVGVTADDDQASEDGRDPATFTFTQTRNAPYAVFTVGGSATVATFDEEGNITNADVADYVLDSAAVPVAGSPGKYKVYFNGFSERQVGITPLNDSKVEGSEDVQFTLVADDTGEAGLPAAYADPAGNGPTLPGHAAAPIVDLVAGPGTDANAPSNATLDAYLNDLATSDDYDTREAARTFLRNAYASHPAIEPHLDEKLTEYTETGPAEVWGFLQEILGPVRFRIQANTNTLVVSKRFDIPGVAKFQVSLPTPAPLLTFSVTGDPNAQGIIVGGTPSSFTLTPGAAATDYRVTFSVAYVDEQNNILSSTSETASFDLSNLWDI